MSYTPIRTEPTPNHFEYLEYSPSLSRRKTTRVPAKIRSPRRSQRSRSKQPKEDFPIIVHSHLCWDWVWQRPQQFMSRLSQKHKVLFVETVAPDPALAAATAHYRKLPDLPNITLLRLTFPTWRWADGAYVDAERRRLVKEFVASPMGADFEDPVQWFYDPMAVAAFAGHMGEILTVYDCMDELSKFRFAPPAIVAREAELLARANVVFTGGRRLFEAKSQVNANCHFFGCGVDEEHFGKARDAATPVPEDLAGLGKPVLGYFGVIDERLDYELIARLADANPGWSVAMIGPVMKVDPAALPRRSNLHWLGQRPYSDLPALCRGFDVCLMPFALNESTEYINPTKTLEYMATGRAIVSTPVPDVCRNFGEVVRIAGNHEEFVQCCRQAAESPDPAAIEKGLQMVRSHSWDSIVARLEQLMSEAMAFKASTLADA
jgi:glycosyltransferase involved in cell wall biosynthesis